MASLRTDVTEIVTGLAMLGYDSLERALSVRPRAMTHVSPEHYDRLESAWSNGECHAEFLTAWDNGWVFARSEQGLRGRPPWRLEWKGPHRPPGYEQIPADLRVDHVYLVSCKYGSTILHNVSPAHLFERSLADRRTERGSDWYELTAPEALQEVYRATVDELDTSLQIQLPEHVSSMTSQHRTLLKRALPSHGSLPGAGAEAYSSFCLAVAQESARRWLGALSTAGQREAMLWRLLRLQPAPYFVLGATKKSEPLRYRVGTPWDFRDRWQFKGFDVWPDPAGQPLVRWRADLVDNLDGRPIVSEGYVEVRWTHGKFGGAPEAKVHLSSDPHQTAGYFPLR